MIIVRESPRMRFQTDLREVVLTLDGAHLGYRWFLSNFQANQLGVDQIGVEAPPPVELQYGTAGDTHDCWLSGARLDEIANQYDFQLIWGVLSALHPDAIPEGKNLEPRPNAYGHLPTGTIQHPDAQIEIIAFDSTFTAITARDTEVEPAFGRYFSQGDASETI
jgi:hypothetical protein